MPLALATPVWIVLAGMVLFGLLVVLRYTLDLVREAKAAAEAASVAAARLRGAAREVEVEAGRARERMEHLGRARREPPGTEPGRPARPEV